MEAMASLVILHLSDLHFGPHSRFGGERVQVVAERFGAAIERHRQVVGFGKIDLVVVSGDLTETAEPEQFEAARKFCEGLNGHLGLGRERWVFVPGNHDLSWAYIELARVEQRIQKFDDVELERRIREYKFRNYAAFLDEFYAGFGDDLERVALSPAGWVQDISALGVSLGLINSSEATTDKARAGKVSAEQAQALLGHWRARREEWLRILVVHHNPQEVGETARRDAVSRFMKRAEASKLSGEAIEHFVADTFGLQGKELLERVATQAEVSLVLHGHVHETPHDRWDWADGEHGTRVLAAGSAGADVGELPADQSNSVQVISIDREDGRAKVLRLRYEPRAEEPGRFERGTFVREADELGGLQALRLSLPRRLGAQPVRVEADVEGIGRSFWKEYRSRLAGRFEVWELGTRQRGSREPSVVSLDTMYVPLRIHAGYDQEKFMAGSVIDVDQLLARERGLVVRGGPGTGKTTWLRWLFRRMVEREDVLPIFLELRALADRWAKRAPAEPHSLEAYLSVWLAEWVGVGWEQQFRAALDHASPRPVLLIDGWDELGDFGREFGAQLVGLAHARPHVLIVATSRPYGEGVSELALRFDELQLQPMSDDEVARFVRNFYERVHRSERERADEHVDRFLRNLAGSVQARHLGRTPLLLVLLLIIGRDRPLPDRRHELYRLCIEEMLDARPNQRQAMGVLQGSAEWAPEHYEERLRAVAKLAYGVQSRHYAPRVIIAKKWREDALTTREQLCADLDRWDPHRRDGFVTWLVSSAGLLLERDDGYLQFAHLGFQEYLSAWHLDATQDGQDARLEHFPKYSNGVTGLWEVVRLWAALIEAKSPTNLAVVLRATLALGGGFWLVGAVLADGLGEEVFVEWSNQLGARFADFDWVFQSNVCAAAWKISQQTERRRRIVAQLTADVDRWTWMQWWRADAWRAAIGAESTLPKPAEGTPAGLIMDALERGPGMSAHQLAWGRVWMSTSPFWGGDVELLGLRLWPVRRSWLGWAIQSAIGFGMGREQVFATPWHRLLHEPRASVADGVDLARSIATDVLAIDLARSAATDITTKVTVDFARHIAIDLAKYVSKELVAAEVTFDLAKYLSTELARSIARDIATNLAKDIAKDIAKAVAEDSSGAYLNAFCSRFAYSFEVPSSQGLPLWFAYSVGFAGTRTVFVHSKRDHDALTELLRTACLHSFDPTLGPLPPNTFTGDPLWPALARHVARCSTPEDRALLETLARSPDEAPEPLRWGLRYYVRGDILFEDGSVVTLDDIWASLREKFPEDADQLRDLPYLDELPPDIELDRAAVEAMLDTAIETGLRRVPSPLQP